MNPKASVIIPVYNAEKTLRRCVESIVLGLERNVEVILCEDCSKDRSWEECCALSEDFSNVRCIQNEHNCGVSYTRNAGLKEASGDHILFVDSDDWVSSEYVIKLLTLSQNNPNLLPVCGHHFIDKVNHIQHDYLWSNNSIEETIIEHHSFFDLCDKFLLQQLWNKIFRRDIIMKHNIRFDETQSMGEDFQFVLDYMEAAQIKQCVILNEPLYYYIRWNNSSLMSKFGFIDNQPEFDRIHQLARIAGPDSEAECQTKIAQIKKNYVYHITGNKTHSKQEKMSAIERIMADGNAASYYRKQKMQYFKEQISSQLHATKQLIPRIKGRIQRKQLNAKISQVVNQVHAEGITFISQNCIGGVLYHDLGLPFLSPTINTFIPEPGFVKMVMNLRYYMEQELVIRWGEEYPIGLLDDVEIHFMHYETCKEAKEAWDRRKARINWDKIFVIATDRDGFDAKVYEQWKQISYPKILFTAHSEFAEGAVYFSKYTSDGQVGDLISERSFYCTDILIRKINSFEG